MLADLRSRHTTAGLDNFNYTLYVEQLRDQLWQEIANFLKNQENTPYYAHHYKDGCFTQNDLLWRRRTNHNYPDRNVIVLPASLNEEIIKAAHGHSLSGQMGISKTKERIS
jgi:hypothetical protein